MSPEPQGLDPNARLPKNTRGLLFTHQPAPCGVLVFPVRPAGLKKPQQRVRLSRQHTHSHRLWQPAAEPQTPGFPKPWVATALTAAAAAWAPAVILLLLLLLLL
jgi:hypothetical protein